MEYQHLWVTAFKAHGKSLLGQEGGEALEGWANSTRGQKAQLHTLQEPYWAWAGTALPHTQVFPRVRHPAEHFRNTDFKQEEGRCREN